MNICTLMTLYGSKYLSSVNWELTSLHLLEMRYTLSWTAWLWHIQIECPSRGYVHVCNVCVLTCVCVNVYIMYMHVCMCVCCVRMCNVVVCVS